MDPLGHLSPWLFKDIIQEKNIDIRPTIAITKAHMKLPELEQSVRAGRLVPDGKICLNETGELAVTKFAVEPVWYLPGVAERFGIGASVLLRIFLHSSCPAAVALTPAQRKECCADPSSKIPVARFLSLSPAETSSSSYLR